MRLTQLTAALALVSCAASGPAHVSVVSTIVPVSSPAALVAPASVPLQEPAPSAIPAAASAPDPFCPAAATWNGLACAPIPATALSPDPPPELSRIDDAIRASFLTTPYSGGTEQIWAQYRRDAAEAKKHDDELQHFTSTCTSRDWTAAAIAQQGMLFDSLATKLDDAIKKFPPSSYFALKHAALLSAGDVKAQAEQLRAILKDSWSVRADAELAGAYELAIRRYATAVDLARKYGLKGVDVDHALARLADYTFKLGEERMRGYVTKANLTYRPGMYLRSSAGP